MFTYTGGRYNDGRQVLEKTLEQQFLEDVKSVNDAAFNNAQSNILIWQDALKLEPTLYIEPPYVQRNQMMNVSLDIILLRAYLESGKAFKFKRVQKRKRLNHTLHQFLPDKVLKQHFGQYLPIIGIVLSLFPILLIANRLKKKW